GVVIIDAPDEHAAEAGKSGYSRQWSDRQRELRGQFGPSRTVLRQIRSRLLRTEGVQGAKIRRAEVDYRRRIERIGVAEDEAVRPIKGIEAPNVLLQRIGRKDCGLPVRV